MDGRRPQPGQRVQLHRALSKLGWGSRKQAWAWIQAGEVRVDGQVESNPLAWVDLERQRITRRGEEAPASAVVTLALHKPKGIVTTRRDERGRRTVYDLLPPGLPWVFPAGRLDADSEGLLILTNDSQLAVRLTDPEQHIPKTYEIILRGRPSAAAMERIRHGLTLRDGVTRPAQVEVLEARPEESRVVMVLTEGRNRQARRMWAAVGHKVLRLKRIAIGSYQLSDLPAGGVHRLSDLEMQSLLERDVRWPP